MNGLAGWLKALTPVSRGQKLRAVLTATRISAIQNAILALARGDNLRTGGTILKRTWPDGVSLFGRRGEGLGGGAETPFPYQITVAPPDPEGDSESQPRLSVEIDSWLMDGLDVNAKKTVSGLGTPFEIRDGFNEDGKAYIWLEATITGSTIGTVTLKHGDPNANGWDSDTFPAPFHLNTTDPANIYQDKAYCLLGYLVAPGADDPYTNRPTVTLDGTTYQIVQCVRTNLLICKVCYNGSGTGSGQNWQLFVPWHAPVY